jgi:hypothetical protein
MNRIPYRRRRTTFGDRVTDVVAAVFAVRWVMRLLWRGWRLA